mgnify:CR=1 FL=1
MNYYALCSELKDVESGKNLTIKNIVELDSEFKAR